MGTDLFSADGSVFMLGAGGREEGREKGMVPISSFVPGGVSLRSLYL